LTDALVDFESPIYYYILLRNGKKGEQSPYLSRGKEIFLFEIKIVFWSMNRRAITKKAAFYSSKKIRRISAAHIVI